MMWDHVMFILIKSPDLMMRIMSLLWLTTSAAPSKKTICKPINVTGDCEILTYLGNEAFSSYADLGIMWITTNNWLLQKSEINIYHISFTIGLSNVSVNSSMIIQTRSFDSHIYFDFFLCIGVNFWVVIYAFILWGLRRWLGPSEGLGPGVLFFKLIPLFSPLTDQAKTNY